MRNHGQIKCNASTFFFESRQKKVDTTTMLRGNFSRPKNKLKHTAWTKTFKAHVTIINIS